MLLVRSCPLAGLLSRGVSKRSIARKLSTLRVFFKYLADSRELDSNPAEPIRTSRFDRRLPAFLDEAQAKEIVEAPLAEHEELSARCPSYRRLYQIQFEDMRASA